MNAPASAHCPCPKDPLVTSSSAPLRFSRPAWSALAAAVLLIVSGKSFAADPAVVLIGHAAPLTGQLSHMGKDSENAARLAIDEINSQHPVIGG
jgi:branched-chain amino acid transport system substrate-binding protein